MLGRVGQRVSAVAGSSGLDLPTKTRRTAGNSSMSPGVLDNRLPSVAARTRRERLVGWPRLAKLLSKLLDRDVKDDDILDPAHVPRGE